MSSWVKEGSKILHQKQCIILISSRALAGNDNYARQRPARDRHHEEDRSPQLRQVLACPPPIRPLRHHASQAMILCARPTGLFVFTPRCASVDDRRQRLRSLSRSFATRRCVLARRTVPPGYMRSSTTQTATRSTYGAPSPLCIRARKSTRP